LPDDKFSPQVLWWAQGIGTNLGTNFRKIRCEEQVKREYKCKAGVLGPLACAWATKLDRRNCCPVDAAETMAQGKGVELKRVTIPDKQFRVMGEPLYRGKSKRSSLIYNHCDSDSTVDIGLVESPFQHTCL
jgi:hypothetical protein